MKTEFSTKTLIYLRAAELVEQGHCKGWLALDKDNDPCPPESSFAKSFCYFGALIRAGHEARVERFIPPTEIILWNNAPDTTAAMVAAKLREQAFS